VEAEQQGQTKDLDEILMEKVEARLLERIEEVGGEGNEGEEEPTTT
jgi:hypothetical protein